METFSCEQPPLLLLPPFLSCLGITLVSYRLGVAAVTATAPALADLQLPLRSAGKRYMRRGAHVVYVCIVKAEAVEEGCVYHLAVHMP